MIGLVQPDRWTCPDPKCGRTVVPAALDEEGLRRTIRAAQVEHAERHASPLETALRALDEQPNASRIE